MVHLKHVRVIAIAISILSLSSCIKEDESYFKQTITFQEAPLAPETYWNGEDGTGSKVFGTVIFNNHYEENEWGGYWEGFAYSNITDIETEGYDNEFSAYVSQGGNPQNKYSVAYVNEESATMSFINVAMPLSILVANTTLAYYSMLNGDDFTSPFDEGDWFMLTATGYNDNEEMVNRIDFYLADYRGENPYIIDEWTFIDLTSLSGSSKIIFTLSSSDNSEYGMNTPAYFCIDNFAIEYRY